MFAWLRSVFSAPTCAPKDLPPMPSGSILHIAAERSPAESGTGYTARELDHITRSARRAAPAGQGSGGDGTPYQGAAAASPIRGRERRAF